MILLLLAAILLGWSCERDSSTDGKSTVKGADVPPVALTKLAPRRIERPSKGPGAPTTQGKLSELSSLGTSPGAAQGPSTGDANPDPGSADLEALSDQTAKKLQALLTAGEDLKAMARETATEDFVSTRLRPRHGAAQRVGPFTAYRGVEDALGDTDEHTGAENENIGKTDLAEALGTLRADLLPASAFAEVKTLSIEPTATTPSEFSTRVRVELSGRVASSGTARQTTATWNCVWRRGSGEEAAAPKLRRITLESFAEAQLSTLPRQAPPPAGDVFFADATQAALANVRDDQHRLGIEYWSQAITRMGDMSLSGHHGLALGDVDGDGLEDLYVCDGGSLPNRLYLQNPDGTVRDASSSAGVDWLEDSRSALLVDFDNDGDQDLVVATIAMVVFCENDGAGTFQIRGGFAGAPYPFSLSAADFDVDGDLDLHVCVYAGGADDAGRRGFEGRQPQPFNDARNGGRNVLLRNEGEFRFRDVTQQLGLDTENNRWSLAAAWEDYDQDGDPDLYVANDFGKNQLFRNDVGSDGKRTLVDVAAASGVEDVGAGMSVAWGDYNRDGQMDLYVGNMFSAAGSRVAGRPEFANSTGVAAADLRRMARGNSLFTSSGRPRDGKPTRDVEGTRFEDRSVAAGVTMGRWAWSSAFVDINNDGWEDIISVNGYLTHRKETDL